MTSVKTSRNRKTRTYFNRNPMPELEALVVEMSAQ